MDAETENIVNFRDDEDPSTAEDSDGDDASFGLVLVSAGLPGGFHTSNPPENRWQRATVTDRGGAVDIRCQAKAMIHGSLGPDTDELATLLVYEFSFDRARRFRRVASVNINFKFSSSVPGSAGPEVHDIAPMGEWSLGETTQQEHIERGTDLTLSGDFSGSTLGGTHKWSKSVDRTTLDYTMLRGSTTCDKFGRETGAKLVLHENTTALPKIGVPSFLRTAILLRRKTDECFECAVDLDIEADWKTRITRFFASKSQEKDDPIFFDPSLPPMNNLKGFQDYNVENLGSVDLEKIFDVTFYTRFGKPIKEQSGSE